MAEFPRFTGQWPNLNKLLIVRARPGLWSSWVPLLDKFCMPAPDPLFFPFYLQVQVEQALCGKRAGLDDREGGEGAELRGGGVQQLAGRKPRILSCCQRG